MPKHSHYNQPPGGSTWRNPRACNGTRNFPGLQSPKRPTGLGGGDGIGIGLSVGDLPPVAAVTKDLVPAAVGGVGRDFRRPNRKGSGGTGRTSEAGFWLVHDGGLGAQGGGARQGARSAERATLADSRRGKSGVLGVRGASTHREGGRAEKQPS